MELIIAIYCLTLQSSFFVEMRVEFCNEKQMDIWCGNYNYMLDMYRDSL